MVNTNGELGVRTIAQGSVDTLLVFVVSFLVFGLTASPEVNAYDEGLILTGASRVAAGAVPHRDFYIVYGPGQFYALAALFDLFGQNVWVERLYDYAVKAGIVSFVYAFSLRLMRTSYAYSVTALCVLWIAVALTPAYPVWPTLLLIFAAIWLALSEGPSPARLAAAGLCAGTAVVFRYDMGLLSLALLSAALIVYIWTDRRSSGFPLKSLILTMAPFWGAAGAVLALLAAAYIRYGIVDDFIFQIITFPSTHYVETRRLPFPAPSLSLLRNPDLIVYMPPVVVLTFLGFMVTGYFNRGAALMKLDGARILIASLIALLAVGLYFKGIVRVSIPHMIASIVPALIVLGFIVDGRQSRQDILGRRAIAVPIIAALALTLVPSVFAAKAARAHAWVNIADAGRAARIRITSYHATELDQRCNPDNSLERAPCFRTSPARTRGHSLCDRPYDIGPENSRGERNKR